MKTASMLWRQISVPGHDVCRVEGSETHWQLDGTAVFRHEAVAALLTYQVVCDRTWNTQYGHVRGWLGDQPVDITITRMTDGAWLLNGRAVEGLSACADLDLGFTPATNLIAIRRLALADGQAADAPAAWLDVAAGFLSALPQRYERRSETTYWYESPTVSFKGLLEVTPEGFVRRYPGLWEAEL
jgi:hypothetical protein